MDQTMFGEIHIETLGPQRVACYRVVSPNPEDDVTQFMQDWITRQNLSVPVRNFGFDVEITPAQSQAGLRGYELWLTVPPEVQPSEGVEIHDFPGGLYAVMRIDKPFVDPFARIPSAWQHLHEWVIQSSDYRTASHPCLEEVLDLPEGKDMDIYHPVMRNG